MLIESIKKHLNEFEASREWSRGLRASNAGKCARAIAYQEHKYEPIPLNWRARLVFRLGDQIEKDLVHIAKNYGLTEMQREVALTIGGVEIKGHIDGICDETAVDFKSTSTFGFKKALAGDVGGYDRQLHFYMKALNLKRALLIYYCKEQSDLLEVVVPWNEETWKEVEERFLKVIRSTHDELPDREYGPDSRHKLDWQCSYCSFVKHCWPDYELSFDGQGKPVLKIKETKNDSPKTRPVGRRGGSRRTNAAVPCSSTSSKDFSGS